MSVITKDKIGIFHYTLTNDAGEVIDSSEGLEPMAYLHGSNNIIPGLETHMEGKSIGDKFIAIIAPADGYGEYNDEAFIQVPREQLPEGVQFKKGAQLIAEDEQGNPMPVWMEAYAEDVFTFTFNHPLAGVTLSFKVEIAGIRDAIAVELEHGHPHGIDGTGGHHHEH